MAKNVKLVDATGDDLVADAPSVPPVTGCTPCGSQVLVEILTPQELMGTKLVVSDKTDVKVTLHGYVRAVGKGCKTDDWGFKVGDRVLFSGTGVLVPSYDGCHRDRFLAEPHAIKGVLSEGK